jgi:hypothetical protein
MKTFGPRAAFLCALALTLGAVSASSADLAIEPVVHNWGEAFFSKEGFHTYTLRGTEMKPEGKAQVDVKNLTIIVWSGDKLTKVDTTIVSPEATFLLEKKFAFGKKAVRVVRDDFDVTGEDWTYDLAQKKVSIAHHTRVVFKATMPDILK